MTQSSFRRSLTFFSLVAIVLFAFLGSARLWDRDEPRNSRASHEMLARGDWIVPTFNGELRDHKPILLYWGQMSSYLAFGESEFSARLPSALCAMLTVVTIAVLGTRLAGRKRGMSSEGIWAAAALGTCMLFVMAGRAATPDACLMAFSTLGIAAIVIAALRKVHPYSSGAVGPARWIPSLFGYAMLGVAVLAKGPVGVILPLAIVHAWWLICKRLENAEATSRLDRSATWTQWLQESAIVVVRETWLTFNPLQCLRALWALKFLPGMVVCLAVAVPWYYAVGVETNGAFLRGFFLDHNVGRAVNSMEGHGGTIFFYPIAFIAGTFPWSLWLLPILLWARKATASCVMQRQMIVLAACWVGVYITAFTIASTKLPSYITPCYAGAALAIGSYLRQFESGWQVPSRRLRIVACSITMCVGLACAITIFLLSRSTQMPELAIASFAGLAILMTGAVALVWEFFRHSERIPVTWLVGAATFHVFLFGFGTKTVDQYRGDLQAIATVSESNPSSNWLSLGGMEPSWVHYLGTEIEEVREHPATEQAQHHVANWLSKISKINDSGAEGYVIAVGDDAKRQLENHFPDRLRLASQGQRFLREGQMAIYQVLESRTSVKLGATGLESRSDLDIGQVGQTPMPSSSMQNR